MARRRPVRCLHRHGRFMRPPPCRQVTFREEPALSVCNEKAAARRLSKSASSSLSDPTPESVVDRQPERDAPGEPALLARLERMEAGSLHVAEQSLEA